MFNNKQKQEVYDCVKEKEPISLREIQRQTSVYKKDDVYIALVALQDENKVVQIDGNRVNLWKTEDI